MVWRVPRKFQTVADEVKLPRFGSLQPCLADSEFWMVLVFACICQVWCREVSESLKCPEVVKVPEWFLTFEKL